MRAGNTKIAIPRTTGRAPDQSVIQRPASRRPEYKQGNSSLGPPVPPVILRQAYEWSHWPSVSVRLKGLQLSTTTYDIWRSFHTHGELVLIDIFENETGKRDGNARIKFSPPPREPFWVRYRETGYMIKVDDSGSGYKVQILFEETQRNQVSKVPSPIRPYTFYNARIKMMPADLHFGFMVDPTSFVSMERLSANPKDHLSFVVDLLRKQIVVTFMVNFVDPRAKGDATYVSSTPVSLYDRKNKHMFEIPFSQLEKIDRIELENGLFSLIISLDSPPRFSRKREIQEDCHSNENLRWTESDTWYRQTDIVYDPFRLQTAIVTTLGQDRPVIDIGRWTTYNFVFDTRQSANDVYDEMRMALQDYNIRTEDLDKFDVVEPRQAELWNFINHPVSHGAVAELQHLNTDKASSFLPFEVRYQLEVCLSRGILNEHNISEEFVDKLVGMASKDISKARQILEYIAERDQRIYDPMSIFEDKDALAYSPRAEIPHYCAYARKATVTPTTMFFSSPTVETTNRVLRHYSQENRDGRFLRVQFTDEIAEGRINSCADKQHNDEIFTRVYRTLFNGIQIGERHYRFLAFGNSQFRENGAYFFCPTEHLSCDDIRQWMGNFAHINVVAKYAARLGQCFSTTRAIHGLSAPDLIKIPDTERNGHCFTDGVGKISSFLAQMITAELGLRVATSPSAFQFRLGGCKGILVTSPDAKDKEVHIRKSQQKFTAVYNGLEIIRWSRFSAATLNRQIITILSSLGVPDDVFLNMLTEQLTSYHDAMSDDALAQALLSKYVDDNQMTINIATMINNGFMAVREPFVLSLLHLWRSWSIKLLKEKAKIIVEDGAFLLGCVDETGSLRGYNPPSVAPGQPFVKEELPQIFVQVPSKDDPNRYNVIEAICLVGRNPSLHPGDLRVVEAVDIPALYHLRDVVVFPQTGERDVPSMCSGGDLDGDDFFVIWDKALKPKEWNCAPMNYAAPEPKLQNTPVQVTDVMKFFVRYIKNDALPTIAHAHLANSDYLNRSVKDPKCLELAALHSKAVDYVKTGQPAEMPKRLMPRKWPHFMEKKFKPASAIYTSERILGKLYDKVESVAFVPQWQEPFDRRILRAYKLDDALLKTVRQTKSKYDTAMLRIMAQQEIKTEFEVWSTFVLSKPRVGTDYKLQEEMARLSDALKDQFRKLCVELAGGIDFAILGPFVAGMYKVTKEEVDIALAECRSSKIVGGREVPKRKMVPKSMPLISFPWLFEKELARIATGVDMDVDSMGLQVLDLKDPSKPRKRPVGVAMGDMDDYIREDNGRIVHRGEELDLFRTDGNSDILSDYDDLEDPQERHSMVIGASGEVVLDTELHPAAIPDYLQSGTGVEDVVPRTILDGFTGSFADHSVGDASLEPEDEPHGGAEEEILDLALGVSSLEKLNQLMTS